MFTRQKKIFSIFSVGGLLLLFTVADSVFADMVTLGGMWIIDRSNILCRLYTEKPDYKILVMINLGFTINSPKLTISCDDKFEQGKVEKASKSIANYINKNDDIDPLKMLSNAGLSNCKIKGIEQ